MRLHTLTRPLVLLLVPVALSVIAWMIPGSSLALRGFSTRANLTFGALLLLLVWYTLVVVVFMGGHRVGSTTRPLRVITEVERDPRLDRRALIVLTVISAIGVLYVLYLAQRNGSIIGALSSGQGNALEKSFASQAGFATLRYTPIVSAPLSVDLWLRKQGNVVLATLNVVLLLAESLFSSRLSLIIAIVVFLFLLARRRPHARIKMRWLLAAALLLFIALAGLNYFRNSLFYREYGVDNPLLMNLYQIATYVGTPFQVSTGVANGMISGTYWSMHGLLSPGRVFVPSFLSSQTISIPLIGRYGGVVDVAPSLTTNSAFADVYWQYGLTGLLLSLVVIFGAAIVFGHAMQYASSTMAAAAGVIGYTLADYWRIMMMNQGIVDYLIVIVFVVATTVASGIPREATSRAHLRPLPHRPEAGSTLRGGVR